MDNTGNIYISPILAWSPVSIAANYTLQVSENNLFSTLIVNQSGITITSCPVTGLSSNKKYFWRVKAVNSYGESGWSAPAWSFTTSSMENSGAPCSGIATVVYYGKTYHTVQIGTQCWLKENLDLGTMIPGAQEQTNNGIIEKYCLNDDANNCTAYGALYQWNEAMGYSVVPGSKGICPEGWKIPTKEEYAVLNEIVSNNGNVLKSTGLGVGNNEGTNISGFSGLSGGTRTSAGLFANYQSAVFFWSSSESSGSSAYFRYLAYSNYFFFSNFTNKENGYSVRCIKN